MPQASEEQQELMKKWFDSIDDHGPTEFLLSHGYTEKAGMWSKPTPSHNPSVAEVECLMFLRDEWDHDFHHPLFPQSLTNSF